MDINMKHLKLKDLITETKWTLPDGKSTKPAWWPKGEEFPPKGPPKKPTWWPKDHEWPPKKTSVWPKDPDIMKKAEFDLKKWSRSKPKTEKEKWEKASAEYTHKGVTGKKITESSMHHSPWTSKKRKDGVTVYFHNGRPVDEDDPYHPKHGKAADIQNAKGMATSVVKNAKEIEKYAKKGDWSGAIKAIGELDNVLDHFIRGGLERLDKDDYGGWK